MSGDAPRALGHALASARRAAGRTRAETAQALSVAPETVANWEAGRTEPRCSQVLRLALFLDTRPLDLFRAMDPQ